MAEKTFHVGEWVKIYYPSGVVKGEVIGINDVSIEDGDKFFYTTKAYLVVSTDEKMQIVTSAFMGKDRTK